MITNGTMERLMNHMVVLAELKAKNASFRSISVMESFIFRDVLELRVAVMTYGFDGMDFFASQGKYSK